MVDQMVQRPNRLEQILRTTTISTVFAAVAAGMLITGCAKPEYNKPITETLKTSKGTQIGVREDYKRPEIVEPKSAGNHIVNIISTGQKGDKECKTIVEMSSDGGSDTLGGKYTEPFDLNSLKSITDEMHNVERQCNSQIAGK
jgi:hypothetical protein